MSPRFYFLGLLAATMVVAANSGYALDYAGYYAAQREVLYYGTNEINIITTGYKWVNGSADVNAKIGIPSLVGGWFNPGDPPGMFYPVSGCQFTSQMSSDFANWASTQHDLGILQYIKYFNFDEPYQRLQSVCNYDYAKIKLYIDDAAGAIKDVMSNYRNAGDPAIVTMDEDVKLMNDLVSLPSNVDWMGAEIYPCRLDQGLMTGWQTDNGGYLSNINGKLNAATRQKIFLIPQAFSGDHFSCGQPGYETIFNEIADWTFGFLQDKDNEEINKNIVAVMAFEVGADDLAYGCDFSNRPAGKVFSAIDCLPSVRARYTGYAQQFVPSIASHALRAALSALHSPAPALAPPP